MAPRGGELALRAGNALDLRTTEAGTLLAGARCASARSMGDCEKSQMAMGANDEGPGANETTSEVACHPGH
eukprot:7124487-Alexandrium_andersonii.AAC.1